MLSRCCWWEFTAKGVASSKNRFYLWKHSNKFLCENEIISAEIFNPFCSLGYSVVSIMQNEDNKILIVEHAINIYRIEQKTFFVT